MLDIVPGLGGLSMREWRVEAQAYDTPFQRSMRNISRRSRAISIADRDSRYRQEGCDAQGV
jgi:hypothetical protein